MTAELSDAQRKSLDDQVAMVKALIALDGVSKHDSRFENEIALKAGADAMDSVKALVTERVGAQVTGNLSDDPVARACGGIRGGQALFRKDLGDGLSLYVAFWPWGGGGTVTIKIGLCEG